MNNVNNMNNMEKIEYIEFSGGNQGYLSDDIKPNCFQSYKTNVYYSVGNAKFTEMFDNVVKSKDKNYSENSSLPKTIVALGGYNSEVYIGVINQKEILEKLQEPVSEEDTDLVDDDKLYFLESVDFPRRKLSTLTSTYGKVKNISTVRKTDRATKIIGNKIKIKEGLEDINKNRLSYINSYSNKLLIKVKYNPNNIYHSQLSEDAKKDRVYYTSLDNTMTKLFESYNLLYAEKEYLKSKFNRVYNGLINSINDASFFRNVYSYTAEKFNNCLPVDQIVYDIESIEVLVKVNSYGINVDIDQGYLNVVNKGLKITDVSKVYEAIGNKTMEYSEFMDLNEIIQNALKVGNEGVVKMSLESISTYDVNTSMLYLSLIFRNTFVNSTTPIRIMNTNVRSLYEHCNSISKFAYERDTNKIIKNILDKGHTIDVPLSLLLNESGIQDKVNEAKYDLKYYYKSKDLFDVDIKVGLSIKPELSSVVNLDLDLENIIDKLNKEEVNEEF